MKKVLSLIVAFSILVCAMPTVFADDVLLISPNPNSAPVFADIEKDDWAYEAIEALSKDGIISGADGLIRPNDPVTRAELSKMIVLIKDFEIASDAEFESPDKYAIEKWALPYIATALREGIIKGFENGCVGADETVTRAQIATVAVRAMKATSENKGDSFSDVASDSWYAKDVECAKVIGIISGYEDGTFRPDNTVTRKEAFAILYRAKAFLDLLQNS